RTFQMCPLPNYLKRAVHEALTTHVCRRAIGRDKVERVFDGRYLVRPHSGVPEALDDVGIHTPGHRTDKAVRGWRHIGRAELQQLRHEGCIAWNPVPHHDAATWLCYPHHLPGNVEGLGC